jgi:cobalamin-dependent methionine synthase I
MLVPPFYGTGDMLSWKTAELLEKIDHTKLFADYWGLPPEAAHAGFTAELEQLCRRLREEELVTPRGYYSFFTVIVEGERVVVLDASDFHTEIATLHLPATHQAAGVSLASFLRPEGAVIAVVAVTLGPGLERLVRAGEGTKLQAVGEYLADDLVHRTATEIRRALFLSPHQGECYPVGSPPLPARDNGPALAELVCTEDRLGVTVSPTGTISPRGSRLCLYLPYGPGEGGMMNDE